MAPELSGKRLELLREVVPKLSRLAHSGIRRFDFHIQLGGNATAGSGVKVQVHSLEIRSPGDLNLPACGVRDNHEERQKSRKGGDFMNHSYKSHEIEVLAEDNGAFIQANAKFKPVTIRRDA